MTQPTLDFPPTCQHGVPHGPSLPSCDRCDAWIQGEIAAYRIAQARGEFDADGFTPAERRAQAKKLSE